MHILSILCVLTWTLTSAAEFIPRVTKSTIKGHWEPGDYDYPEVARFGDSDTLILTFGKRLHVSVDDGEHWETINGIEGNDMRVSLDRFHQDRAFVAGSEKTHEVYFTENEGKTWRKIPLPEDSGSKYCRPITHPFNRRLMMLACNRIHYVENIDEEAIWDESPFERAIYGSDDAGNSFRLLAASESSNFRTTCTFAASEDSVADDDDGIYCIETVEKSEGAEIQSSNQRKIDSHEASFQQQLKSTGILFYTTDLGKTKKTFDELNGFSAESIFVSPSYIAVITSDVSDSRNRRSRLWISKGTSFKAANLPEGVLPLYVLNTFGDDQERLLLDARLQDNKDSWRSMRMLVSDSSGLNFSFVEPVHHSNDDHMSQWGQVGNLKGTLWGLKKLKNEDNAEEKASWLQRLVGLLKNPFSKNIGSNSQIPAYVAKRSFDNGKTWENLKIVDSSGKHRHIFKCDIDDVENCSLQTAPFFSKEPVAGIIISSGIAGENTSLEELWGDDRMTFISRDGGESWELAFEFFVYTAILDFGNIIVAMPVEDSGEEKEGYMELFTKFYFSLDQGKTWGIYPLDEPIQTWGGAVQLEDKGLKINIRFPGRLADSREFISYSIDFSNAFDGAGCIEDDLEKWYLSKGNCIDSKRYSFDRRKPDAKCLMRKTFGELELHEEKCD